MKHSRLFNIASQVVRSQYCNLYQLLGDHVSEETYMQIVENNVLVDIQGDDILYQIFTSMVSPLNQLNIAQSHTFLLLLAGVAHECGSSLFIFVSLWLVLHTATALRPFAFTVLRPFA